jgi:Predicted NAD/FAD-dependent oxidoreductase
MRVGIVGAGAGAAALTHVLDGATDAEVTVLEKSGGLCGRAATRRRGSVTYDYGANYLKSDDDRVVDLVRDGLGEDGLVEAEGPIWTFDGDGTVSEGRSSDGYRWSYRTGLTQIAKRLFGDTAATVHRRTHVETIARDDGRWHLTDADGEEWGPFDRLVLNPPAPQTAALLRGADWDDPARERLAAAAADVDYAAVWSVVLRYGVELDRPYYALINTDDEHTIGWVSREECKPGHVPDGSALVVQAGQDWSAEHADTPAETVVDRLTEETAALFDDDRLRSPEWTDHQFWRYALPEGGVAPGPVRDAEEHGLWVVGDWVAGEARLHAALRSGLDVGERLALA